MRNARTDGGSETAFFQKLGGGKMTDSGKHDFRGTIYRIRIGGDLKLRAHGVQRFHDRGQISRAIIDDSDLTICGNAHKSPFVLGSMSPSCLSREQATRSARANALNKASIL